ncbi:hypothetical protein GCM10008106_32570 [Mongoliitalea lutea]|uniref:Uncharacterized protein n=1 Tax=Mongoliitalea lutea TaxID=849756 RepID=A0A8J3G746_9BACT|nr:hypothetical protein GCM10008106_32570 [Mongoliitalea lutea]
MAPITRKGEFSQKPQKALKFFGKICSHGSPEAVHRFLRLAQKVGLLEHIEIDVKDLAR